jgi:transforming growth factor-beta-induced protein
MKRTRTRTRTGAIAAVASLSLLAAACGDDGDDTAAGSASEAPAEGESTTAEMTEPMTTEPMMTEPMATEPMTTAMTTESDESMGSDMATGMEPTGPGCASVPADGEGSFAGMADDPAATAASNNPELSTLVAAVDAAGLVDTLNGEGPFTIFAPANSAFEKIPAADLDAVMADPEGALTDILTLHVVQGEQLSGADLAAAGTVDAIAGPLTITAEGDTVMVDAGGGPATVVCADVPTANATVHIIDTVLMPGS